MQLRKKPSYYALITASLAVPLFMFCVTAWLHRTALLRESTADAMRAVSLFERHALNLFDTHQLIAERINDSLAGMEWHRIGRSASVTTYLKGIQQTHPQIDTIWLVDPSGTVRAANRTLPIAPITVTNRDYFTAIRDQRHTFHISAIRDPHLLKDSGILFAYPRTGAGAVFNGMSVVTVAAKYFTSFWMSASTPAETVALITTKGQVLTASHPRNQAPFVYPPEAVQHQAFKAADSGSYFASPANGNYQRLYVFKKLAKYNLYLLYSIDMQTILDPWKSSMLLYGILFSAASLLWLLLVISGSGSREDLELQVAARTELLNREILVRKQVERQLIANQQKQSNMATELSLLDQQVRLNIATELHDQIGQSLLLCRIKLVPLVNALQAKPHAGIIQDVLSLLDGIIQSVRTLTMQLSPPVLATAGLEAALEWLCNQMREDYGLYFCFEHDYVEKPLSEVVRSVVYQAARELMINVAKHAHATVAWITFKRSDNTIILEIRDDGIGLPSAGEDQPDELPDGFGLFNIRRQINFIGGELQIRSRRGEGTTVTIRIPVQRTGQETQAP